MLLLCSNSAVFNFPTWFNKFFKTFYFTVFVVIVLYYLKLHLLLLPLFVVFTIVSFIVRCFLLILQFLVAQFFLQLLLLLLYSIKRCFTIPTGDVVPLIAGILPACYSSEEGPCT